MTRFLTILIFLSATSVIGQVHIINEGDTRYMVKGTAGDWNFKEHLADGRWIACEEKKDTNFISKEAYYKNGVKNGVESNYYAFSSMKYAMIEYKDGLKHGTETHLNVNRTIDFQLNWIKGRLNGQVINNWTEGAPNFTGFYKNNIRDSLWTFYYSDNKIAQKIKKIVRYDNGKQYLLQAWNEDGVQIIKDGNGAWTTARYEGGLRHGLHETKDSLGNVKFAVKYQNGLLIYEQRSYEDWNMGFEYTIGGPKFIRHFEYDSLPTIDSQLVWIDTYVTYIFETEINYNYKQYKSGLWTYYHKNGSVLYSGEYEKDQRKGIWNWFYPNGKNRMKIDYTTKSYEHFDSTGNLISTYPGEYFSNLTETGWFFNGDDFSKLTLEFRHTQAVSLLLIFEVDNTLKIISWLECGKNLGEKFGSWSIVGDQLTLNIPDDKTYKYKIEFADNREIKLKKL